MCGADEPREDDASPTLTPALKCYDDISLQELGLCLFSINHLTGTGGGPLATQPTPGGWPRRWQLPFKFNANKKGGCSQLPYPKLQGLHSSPPKQPCHQHLHHRHPLQTCQRPGERLEQTHKWPPWPLLSGIIPVSCAAGGRGGGLQVAQGWNRVNPSWPEVGKSSLCMSGRQCGVFPMRDSAKDSVDGQRLSLKRTPLCSNAKDSFSNKGLSIQFLLFYEDLE